jgi:hypothetical protein
MAEGANVRLSNPSVASPASPIKFLRYQPPSPISTNGGLTNQPIPEIPGTQCPRPSRQPSRRSSVSQPRMGLPVRPMWGRVPSDGEMTWVRVPRRAPTTQGVAYGVQVHTSADRANSGCVELVFIATSRSGSRSGYQQRGLYVLIFQRKHCPSNKGFERCNSSRRTC